MATASSDRFLTLDVIRGIAVMGILSVNIVGMSMTQSTYFYPPEFGFEGVGDKVMWTLNSIFVDGRFRSLFSILFGASSVLVIERAVAAGRKGWQAHYPRMIVLLLFGLAHYYMLWWGDILANYAMVGMIAYVFWRLQAKWLLLAAIVVLLVSNGRQIAEFLPQMAKVEQGLSAEATPEQRAKVEEMISMPPAEELAEHVAEEKADHASIPAHIKASTTGNAALRPFFGVLGYGPETLGLMLLGMAAFKSGFLTGGWSRKRYAWIATTFLGTDLLVHTYAAWVSIEADFAPQVYFPWTQMYVAPLHPIGALGYAALIILLFKGRSALGDRFAAVGRAAFTNYLGATLIGTLLFFGTFGGLFAELSRGESWLLVPPIWAFMLVWSKWWLDRFQYGPFEWAWRSLSRWERQPMLKGPAGA